MARASSLGRVASTVLPADPAPGAARHDGSRPALSWAGAPEDSLCATGCGGSGGGRGGIFRGLYFTMAAVQKEQGLSDAASQLIWWVPGLRVRIREGFQV